MLAAMMINIAWLLLDRNGCGEKPTTWMNSLTSPCWPNSIDHMSETTTQDVTTGRKYAVRKSVRKGKCSFMAIAKNSGITVSPMTTNTVKNTVLRSAVRNSASVKRWVKLVSPTNVGVLLRVASNRLKYSEYSSGYARTRMNRMRKGARSMYAARDSRNVRPTPVPRLVRCATGTVIAVEVPTSVIAIP